MDYDIMCAVLCGGKGRNDKGAHDIWRTGEMTGTERFYTGAREGFYSLLWQTRVEQTHSR